MPPMEGGGERFEHRGRGEGLRLPFYVGRLKNRGQFCVPHCPCPVNV